MSVLENHKAASWKVKLFGALRMQPGGEDVLQTSPCGLQGVGYAPEAGKDVEVTVDWLVESVEEIHASEDPEMLSQALERRVKKRIAAAWTRVEKARIRATFQRLTAGRSQRVSWEKVLEGMRQLKIESTTAHTLQLFQSVCDTWREVGAEQFDFLLRFGLTVGTFGDAFILEVEQAISALLGTVEAEQPDQRRRRRRSSVGAGAFKQAPEEVRALAAQRLANCVHHADEVCRAKGPCQQQPVAA